MKLNIFKKIDYKSILVFAIFFVALMLIQRFVFPYEDDYGYMSLSYNYIQPTTQGTNFSFFEFVDYYIKHYSMATGRIFWQSLTSLILRDSIWVARIMQSVMITLVLASLTYFVSKRIQLKRFYIAILACSFYALIEIFVIDKSIFWFSATVTYVWSLIPFFLLINWFYEVSFENKKISVSALVIACIVAFFVATAHEQTATGLCLILGLLLLYKLIKQKKLEYKELMVLLCAVGGLLFLLLAPATTWRYNINQVTEFVQHTSLPVPQRILSSSKIMIQYLFSKNFTLLMGSVVIAGIAALATFIKNKDKFKVLNIICLVILSFTLISMFVFGSVWDAAERVLPVGILRYAAMVLIVLVFLYTFLRHAILNNKLIYFIMMFAGVAVTLAISMSWEPIFGRVYILLIFYCFPMLIDIFANMILQITKSWLRIVVLSVFVAVGTYNMIGIGTRYYNISLYPPINFAILEDATKRYHNGEAVSPIKLIVPGNIESNVFRPTEGIRKQYDDTATGKFLKEIYRLPQDTVFEFSMDVDEIKSTYDFIK